MHHSLFRGIQKEEFDLIRQVVDQLKENIRNYKEKNMFKEAILRYKWYALASVLLTSIVVATTLMQPSYLQDVLTAVLANDKEEIVRVGKLLLIIAGIGLWQGLSIPFQQLRFLREYLRIFVRRLFGRSKASLMLISKSLTPGTWLFG